MLMIIVVINSDESIVKTIKTQTLPQPTAPNNWSIKLIRHIATRKMAQSSPSPVTASRAFNIKHPCRSWQHGSGYAQIVDNHYAYQTQQSSGARHANQTVLQRDTPTLLLLVTVWHIRHRNIQNMQVLLCIIAVDCVFSLVLLPVVEVTLYDIFFP